MIYKGYNVYLDGNGVAIEGIRDFDPVHTFECGQCFRWHKESDGSYTGVVNGRVANVVYTCYAASNLKNTYGEANDVTCIDGRLVIRNTTFKDFEQIWFDYFDLGRDYSVVKKTVAIDGIMKKAVEFGSGIRLLRQEPWETLISFILSSNNRIPRIMKIIEDISRFYGRELEYDGKRYYGFPDIQSLAACSLEQIQVCRAGYRCGYIHKTAAKVALGEFDLQKLAGLETAEARNCLLQLHGVGNKVADCMLLYSGTKYDVFPTDVWVKRVMEELYFKRETSFREIQQFASENFGNYSGMAQQYLFYYAREHRIGI